MDKHCCLLARHFSDEEKKFCQTASRSSAHSAPGSTALWSLQLLGAAAQVLRVRQLHRGAHQSKRRSYKGNRTLNSDVEMNLKGSSDYNVQFKIRLAHFINIAKLLCLDKCTSLLRNRFLKSQVQIHLKGGVYTDDEAVHTCRFCTWRHWEKMGIFIKIISMNFFLLK